MAKDNKEANKDAPLPVKTSLIKDGFFGWNNIKWFIMESRDIYSNKDSYFSKKRIESGIAFVLMQWGMVTYFVYKYQGMDIYDLIMWAGVQGVICGYTINKIQKEKSQTTTDTPPTPTDTP